MQRHSFRFDFLLLSLGLAWELYGACREFYNVAWGTGTWLGEFSAKWFILFALFTLACLGLLLGVCAVLWKTKALESISAKLISLREKMGAARWLLAILVLVFPTYFLQYTVWGVVFTGNYIRILIWVISIFIFAALITKGAAPLGWKEFLAALMLASSALVIAAALINVSDYPFSIGWSEGNRLWDYSTLFGRDRYIYPADKQIPVLLDLGRQFVGGLPFIFRGVSIQSVRLWVGLTFVLPYLILGLATFRALAKNKALWLIMTLWVFLFLKQGPIHPPLVLSAALVALAWNAPLWFAIPLMLGAGYFAQASRITWLFAPAIWIVMLEFVGGTFSDKTNAKKIWSRSIVLGLSGAFAGFILPKYIQPIINFLQSMGLTLAASGATLSPDVSIAPPVSAASRTLFDSVVNLLTVQPLLWYRLLPNSTYSAGILLALLLAIIPLCAILFYLLVKKFWLINGLQKTAIFLPLLIFMAIGLIASAKIGGGGDLHNMDMFLISLMFIGALAWYNGGREWIQNGGAIHTAMKIIIILLITIPALSPLHELYPYNFGEDAGWLMTLADAPDQKTLGMLPTRQIVDNALQTIQEEVALAQQKGDVLFLDQRQLLTFGYIKNVPLIADYEKKVLMNEALSSNAAYFAPFYKDLAAQRFTLIVSEPLRQNNQDSGFQFGEENNAWVKWVSTPILCYYEEKMTIKTVGVQLLVPTANPTNCSDQLPQGNQP